MWFRVAPTSGLVSPGLPGAGGAASRVVDPPAGRGRAGGCREAAATGEGWRWFFLTAGGRGRRSESELWCPYRAFRFFAGKTQGVALG